MKKLISLILILCLAAGIAPAFGETATETDALPAVGDVVFGFEAKEIRPFETFGGR